MKTLIRTGVYVAVYIVSRNSGGPYWACFIGALIVAGLLVPVRDQ